jgi:hypothetical protein
MQLDRRPMRGVAEDLRDRVEHPCALHGAQVHGCAVIDLYRRQNGAAHDVTDVGPVPDLLPSTPDHKRILADKRARSWR